MTRLGIWFSCRTEQALDAVPLDLEHDRTRLLLNDDASGSAEAESPAAILASLDAELARLDALPRMDEARFLATHSLFEGQSDQRQRIINELCTRLRQGTGRRREAFRVLGVGCGSGEIDVALALTLAAQVEQLAYVGVDPSRAECEAFERMFAAAGIPNLGLEARAETFEDFVPEHDFDLVHLVHSLYYMPDVVEAIARAHQMLAPGGCLVVVQAPREELNELAVRFYDRCYERPTLFSGDLEQLLEGWVFGRCRIDGRLDVSPLVNSHVGAGDALRDFIIQVDGRKLPRTTQELVARYLRAVSFHDGGRHFIPHRADAFFIPA